MVKETNFKKRLSEVRKAVFGTQRELAEWLFKEGVIGSPAQTTVQTWENDKGSLRFSKTVLDKLKTLEKLGVNPQYFDQVHVTDWRMERKVEVSEERSLQMQQQITELMSAMAAQKTVIEQLRAFIAKEEKPNPLVEIENQRLKERVAELMEENRILKAQILEKKIGAE